MGSRDTAPLNLNLSTRFKDIKITTCGHSDIQFELFRQRTELRLVFIQLLLPNTKTSLPE
jgi:hypothetical protein